MNEPLPLISVIVPTENVESSRLKRALQSILNQTYPHDKYNVVVVTHSDDLRSRTITDPRVKVLVAEDHLPGPKRNLGCEYASHADILVFCDDDTLPPKNWLLSIAEIMAEDTSIAAFGGPNLTMPDSTVSERMSGYVYTSFVGSARSSIRYRLHERNPVEFWADETDLQACNLAIRADVLRRIGGFAAVFPSEESILLRTLQSKGYKMKFSSSIALHHHRKPLWKPFLRQSYLYGLGRGRFLKKNREGLRAFHLIPTAITLTGLTGMLLALAFPWFTRYYILLLAFYFVILLMASAEQILFRESPKYIPVLGISFALHHISYGIGFVRGMLSSFLSREM